MKTSPYYQQSNEKGNAFMVRIRKNAFKKKGLFDHDHAKTVIDSYIAFYNNQRLHSAKTYIAKLINSLTEQTKYMKKGRKRFMREDSKKTLFSQK